MSSDKDPYRQKYTKMAREFWSLQQLEKTEEEIKYDNILIIQIRRVDEDIFENKFFIPPLSF